MIRLPPATAALARASACATVAALVVACSGSSGGAAPALPVVYTLRTVADGQLGTHVFSQALVTLTLQSDTAHVQVQGGSAGGMLYTNSAGVATVNITDGNATTTAQFNAGEVYVRYDAGAGIAGFGSPISPTYPIALGCDDYAYPSDSAYVADCKQADWGPQSPATLLYDNGLANALAVTTYYKQPSAGPDPGWWFSAPLLALPNTLAQSTLLSGRVHACAGAYTIGANLQYGDLQVCSGPAPRGLHTNLGDFFLQDRIGGSQAPPNPFGWAGWSVANTGTLQVEVLNP